VRLRSASPAAVEADLARSSAPLAGRLRRVIAQNAHLLGPVEPASALTTILTSRLGGVPEVADQLPALRTGLHSWTAWPTWPLPDQPSDALIRIFTGHTDTVNAVGISPDGTWLATASWDGTARIWAADGTPRVTLAGHNDQVRAVAISPDGTWLATASTDGTARIWTVDQASVPDGTVIRVDGIAWDCAWLPGSTDLIIAADRGIYRFSVRSGGVRNAV
jgi:WD40 repeat protein